MKQGAENMIERSAGDKKQLADAQTMLADSRRKIDYIRMQQLRLRNMKSGVPDDDRNYRSFGFFMYSNVWVGGLVAEWLACWTQAQKGPGSNRSRNAVK